MIRPIAITDNKIFLIVKNFNNKFLTFNNKFFIVKKSFSYSDGLLSEQMSPKLIRLPNHNRVDTCPNKQTNKVKKRERVNHITKGVCKGRSNQGIKLVNKEGACKNVDTKAVNHRKDEKKMLERGHRRGNRVKKKKKESQQSKVERNENSN